MENRRYAFNDQVGRPATQEEKQARANKLSKVFMFLFLGIGITAGVSLGLYYLLINYNFPEDVYVGLLIGSAIFNLILIIAAQIFCLRKGRGGLVVYILYTISMGIMMSSIYLAYEMLSIVYCFLAASGMFLAMGVYGFFAKKGVSTLGYIGVGLLFGTLIMTIINIFLRSDALFWLISYVGLFAVLAITAWDVHRAKEASDAGVLDNSMAVYFALELYTDFIYILMRLIAMFAKSKN